MTIGEDARVEGFSANLEWNGRACFGPNGDSAQMLVADADSLDPNMPLGEDLREYVTLDCVGGLPPWKIQDIITFDGNKKVRLVKRLDNPANPFNRFYAVKVVPGVDT